VQIGASGDKGQATQVVVLVPGPPDFHLVKIRPELFLPLTREIEIGDKLFDSTFFIEGPAALVLALLDAETRHLLLCVNAESQFEISTGELRVNLADEKIPSVLPLLLDIGQRFTQPIDIPQRLAENAHRNPEAGVRLQNLLPLIRDYAGDPRTLEALRTSCLDPNPEIRLRAAKELGAEGHDALLKLAEGLVDDTLSAEAVSALGRELPFERTQVILDHARTGRRLRTIRACLEVLGRSGSAPAVSLLAKVMALEKGDLAADAAQALGETGNPAAEPWLIPALQREEKDLRVAAAKSLGHVGSAEAVLPLKEAAESSWLNLELRRAARQAIAEIQSRLPGATPGQLSLAGGEAGQLSLAQAEAGQLSLSMDSAGQLSLGDAEKPPEEA